jgi:26S proteasome regulatory subunit T1
LFFSSNQVDRLKYAIQIPLPPKIDPTVSLMEVEEKPDVTYDDVGGSKKALVQPLNPCAPPS